MTKMQATSGYAGGATLVALVWASGLKLFEAMHDVPQAPEPASTKYFIGAAALGGVSALLHLAYFFGRDLSPTDPK